MAKKKQQVNERSTYGTQLKLEQFSDEQEIISTKKIWKARLKGSDIFKIAVAKTTYDSFLKKINAKTAKGQKYSDEERHGLMVRWIMDKMQPMTNIISGDEFESSIRTLYELIFEERFDKDFDDMGKQVETGKLPVEGGPSDNAGKATA